MTTRLRRILIFSFFLSGLTSLIYEVVWTRKLSLIFGTTTYAVSSILAIFFAGLAIGSYVFGKLVAQEGFSERLLWLYGIIELGIGVYATLTPLAFKLIERYQVWFWRSFSPHFSNLNIFTTLLSFASLIFPTILIGGTLPVLSKLVVKSEKEVESEVGLLYFVNTAGGVLGVFLASFVLISSIGINKTIYFTALINFFLAGIIISQARNFKIMVGSFVNVEKIKISKKRLNLHLSSGSLLIVVGIVGFFSLALEVFWTRILVMVFGGSVYAFATVLIVFLLGIALGSGLIVKLANQDWNSLVVLAVLEILLGISIIISLPFLGELQLWFFSLLKVFSIPFVSLQMGIFLLAFAIMIGPTLLMGMAFPIAVKAYQERQIASRVGNVYAANTAGGVFGSLIGSFILIPTIGLQKGIWFVAVGYLTIGVGIILVIRRMSWLRVLILISFFSFIWYGYRFPSWNKTLVNIGAYQWGIASLDIASRDIKRTLLSNKDLIYYREGVNATVAVFQDKVEGVLTLNINGKADASSGEDMENQILLGHLPMFFHRQPKDVLVIGLGSGVTLGSVERYPVNKIDLVEIEPAVVEAAKYFAKYNNNALDDPRVNVVSADARNYLLATNNHYDVITSEPSNLWLTGVSHLFTKEFYQLARSRLKDGGVMVQWLHLYGMREKDFKTATKTFLEVFPESLAFNLFSYDMLLIGKKEKVTLALEQIETKMKQEQVKADLARIALDNPVELLAYVTMDGEALRAFSEKAPVHSDDYPILEFSLPKNFFQTNRSAITLSISDYWIDPSQVVSGILNYSLVDQQIIFRNLLTKLMVAYSEGNFEEGIFFGNRLREMRIGHPGINNCLAKLYFDRASFLLKQNEIDGAKKDLLRSLEIKPRIPTHFILGTIFLEEGNVEEAKAEFEKIIEESPGLAEAHYNLGLVYEKNEDLKEAVIEFEKALKLDPDIWQARDRLEKLLGK